MIHVRHNRGVIFADRGWRGALHRWRMWRNDRFNRELDKYNKALEKNLSRHEKYRQGFLDNQNDIDEHFADDAPGQDFPAEPCEKKKPLRVFHNPAVSIFW
ncbi:MAG: hypothetical protein HFE49_00060 [Clostridia bacterium]|nr:hypothetical protein [Clostridia bacterium]